MWLSDDGRFNVLAVDDPSEYFSAELKRALQSLTDRELVRLELEVNAVRDAVMEELHGSAPDGEDRYIDEVLPSEYSLDLLDATRSLHEQIVQQIAETPLRWRLERAFLLSEYVAETGPSLRRYGKIVERLQREGA